MNYINCVYEWAGKGGPRIMAYESMKIPEAYCAVSNFKSLWNSD